MLSLIFYVPDSHLDAVKAAVFKAGAGKLGNYDNCCWQTIGQGQFRPLPGSKPHLGTQGKLEVLDEWKVEVICANDKINQVVAALKASHPYETVAYLVLKPEEL
ncbi:MAG: NGG1p interacting factor NIF3 [Bdellovibrionota bacterium]